MDNISISPENLNSIISQFMPFIEKKALSYKPNGFTGEDLIQEGRIALLSAVNTYKKEKGVSFETYAKRCISNGMASFIRFNLSLKSRPLSGYASLDDTEIVSENDPIDRLLEKEALELFKDKLSESLSENEKRVLGLYLRGEGIKDISSFLKSDEKSVQNALYRIRQKIKKII
jgi:RNA polymerase sporulation-specific sigma factor